MLIHMIVRCGALQLLAIYMLGYVELVVECVLTVHCIAMSDVN